MISLAIDKADAVIQDEKLKDLHDNLLHVQYYHENYVSTLESFCRKSKMYGLWKYTVPISKKKVICWKQTVISKNIWAEDRIFSVTASDEGPFSFSQDCLYFTGSPIPSLSSEVQTPNLYQKVVQNYHVNKFRIELLLNHFLIGQEIIRYNNEIIEIISFFKKRTYSEYEAEELEE